MEWLWLLLALAGLGVLWLAIVWVERMVKRIKSSDDARRANAQALQAKIAREETDFLRVQAAKEFIENPQADTNTDPNHVPQEFKDAILLLDGDELLDSLVKRAFGSEQNAAGITATQSALVPTPAKTVVAKSGGVAPVKPNLNGKVALTKAEQKIYKKIKQKG